jgi:hypothetical protein
MLKNEDPKMPPTSRSIEVDDRGNVTVASSQALLGQYGDGIFLPTTDLGRAFVALVEHELGIKHPKSNERSTAQKGANAHVSKTKTKPKTLREHLGLGPERASYSLALRRELARIEGLKRRGIDVCTEPKPVGVVGNRLNNRLKQQLGETDLAYGLRRESEYARRRLTNDDPTQA